MSTKTSKRLSYILRHNPDSVGLKPDEFGWLDLEELVAAMQVPKGTVQLIVATDDKNRFEILDGKIRARQGHSYEVNLGLKPLTIVDLPETLYHGTAVKNVEKITSEGLKPMGRNYVHLSGDYDTAVKVGSRHGDPIVFSVDVAKLLKSTNVYLTTNGVYLAKRVPVNVLRTVKSQL